MGERNNKLFCACTKAICSEGNDNRVDANARGAQIAEIAEIMGKVARLKKKRRGDRVAGCIVINSFFAALHEGPAQFISGAHSKILFCLHD
jgi:hypothetical protein